MEKETQIPQLPQCAVSSRTFFDDIERHFELMNEPDYALASHKFEVGKKLYLEVEVQDSEMTMWLFKWLYGKGKDEKQHTPFGCKLETIHFNNPSNAELKQKLLQLADTL